MIYNNQPFTNSNDRNLSSYTPVTTVSSVQLAQLKENSIELSMPQQMSSSKRKSIDSNTSSIESVGDIDILHSIASANKYTGERIWLDSTSSLYHPAFVSDSSQPTRTFQSESQWQSNPYFDQEQQPTIATTVGTSFASHHPLNLKWILTPQNEE